MSCVIAVVHEFCTQLHMGLGVRVWSWKMRGPFTRQLCPRKTSQSAAGTGLRGVRFGLTRTCKRVGADKKHASSLTSLVQISGIFFSERKRHAVSCVGDKQSFGTMAVHVVAVGRAVPSFDARVGI